MPAHRKPLAVLELSGAAKARPGGYKDRKNQPVASGGIGRPPSHFDAQQRSVWREIIRAVPDGVLTASDRFLVEMGVYLVGRLRSGAASKPSETAILLNVIGRLGLTPVDRNRITIPPPPPEGPDPWDDLINGKF